MKRGLFPHFFGEGVKSQGLVNFIETGIPDILIAFHCNFGDILHGSSTKLRNAHEIPIFSLALPLYPQSQGT